MITRVSIVVNEGWIGSISPYDIEVESSSGAKQILGHYSLDEALRNQTSYLEMMYDQARSALY